jgi:predicted exporter
LFYLILISTTVFFTFFSLKITFEEDLSKLLPSVEKGGAEQLVFSNLKVKDKIFILFRATSQDMQPDDMTDICDKFIRNLSDKDTVYNAIHNVLYRIDESVFQNGIDFLYDNVPVFLDSVHYPQLDALMEKEQLAKQMEENYSTLISPAGMAFKDIIVKDPIGMRNMFGSLIENIGNGLGGNYIFYNNHIFTADTSIVLAFLAPNFKSFDSKQNIRLDKMIKDEIKSFRKQHAGIEILYHGSPVQGVYNSGRIKQDLLLTISVSLVLIFVILIICFRNKSTLVYLILPVIYGTVFALAIMYLIKGSMSLMAMGIGAVVMGVAFSYCLHVITHFKYVNDPEKVLNDQTVPVILGSLTTIGAFLGLMFTKSELLRDFGLFASLGLTGTTLFCLFFLPPFFNMKTNRKSEKAFRALEKINSFPFEKQRVLIVLIILLSIGGIVFSGDVKFDSNLRHIGYHHKKIVRSQELLSSKATNNQATIYFAAVSENLDSALIGGRQLCKKLDQLVECNKIKGYSAAFSLFIPEAEQQRRIDLWNNYWTDQKKADIRQLVTATGTDYQFLSGTFTPFFDLLDTEYSPVSLYESGIIPPEVAENIIEYTDNKYLVFIPVQMNRDDLSEIGDSVVSAGANFVVIDPMYYTNDMVKIIHNDFIITLAISSVFVLIVLLISFRSIILAILAFLPMGLSWYILLGIMAVFGMEFNLINIVISTFIFGIGVDYSIFIMDGLLIRYRTKEPVLIYHKTAIFFSAVILMIVITSLLFAIHPAISSIGLSALIGMGATIIIAYSLQPYLFNLLITNRTEQKKSPIALAWLFSLSKAELPSRKLKNNYLYKGHQLRHRLDKELKQTTNYKLLSETLHDTKSLLDYGCSYGYTSYYASIIAPDASIVGFDACTEDLTIADNCYQKTDRMHFTSDVSVLNEEYETLIIHKDFPISDESVLSGLFAHAKVVVLRKNTTTAYDPLLKAFHFKKKDEDAIFTVYVIIENCLEL